MYSEISTDDSLSQSQLSMPHLFDGDNRAGKRSRESATDDKSVRQKYDHDDAATGGEEGIGNVVAAHYNNIEEKGIQERTKSRIFYLRNFNNWIKSILIKDYLEILEKDSNRPLNVLDMGCGKGGDLFKWVRGKIKHLIFADIADTSINQCKTRYNDLKSKRRNRIFSSEFITADCTKVRLREKFQDVTLNLDLVSCQFAFHYCFESLPQAEMMLKNASECLRSGGFFIGTIPDAADIVHRVKQSNSDHLNNEVFKIELIAEEPYPLFGAKYNFFLEGVVDCPEFLVHFPTLVKLAAKFGLKLVTRERFSDYYKQKRSTNEFLLTKMLALEEYPGKEARPLVGSPEDYGHAERFLADNKHCSKVGTLSHSEWQAISLYQIFVFEKVKTQWGADGKPVYDL